MGLCIEIDLVHGTRDRFSRLQASGLVVRELTMETVVLRDFIRGIPSLCSAFVVDGRVRSIVVRSTSRRFAACRVALVVNGRPLE